MKRPLSVCAVALCFAAGCGSDDASGGVFQPASGAAVDALPGESAISALSVSEASDLCAWFAERVAGGQSAAACADAAPAARDFDCGRTAGCTATVAVVRACADARVAIAAACDPATPASCQQLAAACGRVETEPPPAPPEPLCQPGQQQACSCVDGTAGVSACSSGGWAPCECSRTCIPDQVYPCTCGDLTGVQLCAQDGRSISACACTPVEPTGSCEAAACPDPGVGTPCCMTLDGPCGVNIGLGCEQCIVGEGLPCTCPDGSRGSAQCESFGQWLPCSCGP